MNTPLIPENLPFTAGQRLHLEDSLGKVLRYRPRIGVIGKTGAGKSSLCNALFGAEVARVSTVEACTRQPQEIDLTLGNHQQLRLVDLPGVGESQDRDGEYAELYGSLLPQLDAVLWLIKADDRAYALDERFYRQVVAPHLAEGLLCLFVISQADRMEPVREWDEAQHRPGKRQDENLQQRRAHVAGQFGVPLSSVVVVSALENYQLDTLVEQLVLALPDEKRVGTLKSVQPEHRSLVSVQAGRESLVTIVTRTLEGMMKGAGLGARFGKVGAVVGAIVGAIGGFLNLW
jgi:predicted GTPase